MAIIKISSGVWRIVWRWMRLTRMHSAQTARHQMAGEAIVSCGRAGVRTRTSTPLCGADSPGSLWRPTDWEATALKLKVRGARRPRRQLHAGPRVRIASSVEAEPGTSRPGQGRGCACNSVQEGLLYIRTRSTERAYLRQGYNWCNKNISHDELYQHLFLKYTGYVRVSISRSDYKFF